MHPRFEHAHELSSEVIGAAVEVHRLMGPGLIESIYERCLLHELELRAIPARVQQVVCVKYKGVEFDDALRCDILVGECLLLELKSVETVLPIHKAQLLSYMKLLDVPIGLLINFHSMKLVDGVHRLFLKDANLVSSTSCPS
jgi:GxxExxY protein